jgi:nicotinamidase-related amidase
VKKKKMLVVVDYQNDFVDGSLGFPGAELLDAGIAAEIRKYTENGDVVIATLDSHDDEYLSSREGRRLPIEHAILGTHGEEMYGKTGTVFRELLDAPGNETAWEITKRSFGVAPDDMVAVIRACCDLCEGGDGDDAPGSVISEIKFVGLVSSICVLSNICVFQAAFPEAQIVVDADLIGDFDPNAEAAMLAVLKSLQVEVIWRKKPVELVTKYDALKSLAAGWACSVCGRECKDKNMVNCCAAFEPTPEFLERAKKELL